VFVDQGLVFKLHPLCWGKWTPDPCKKTLHACPRAQTQSFNHKRSRLIRTNDAMEIRNKVMGLKQQRMRMSMVS
jgi:hypothetical protein